MTEDKVLEVIERAARDRVTELDLSGHGLKVLPPEIGRLKYLQRLVLGDKWDGNELEKLPPEISHLEQLRELKIASNKLKSLPPEIGHLRQLQHLDLGGYKASNHNQLSQLPSELWQLTYLQSLNFHANQLNRVSQEIGQLTHLQSLDLSSNQLTQLPPEIRQLTSLQSLDLSSNQLTQLPPEIGQLTSLQSLNLSSNELTQLPPEIGQLTYLQSLDLSSNHLTEFPPEIGQLTILQSLYLINNHLSELPPEIGQLTHLQSLYLINNHLSQLPPEIGQLTYIQSLDLINNHLSQLPLEIVQLTSLESLDLSSNQLTRLHPEIGQLTRLQFLKLSRNQLSELPPEIGQLTRLQTLYLRDNQLSQLPTEISLLINLESLSLRDNQLIQLPQTITQLPNLGELDLRGNDQLPIPPEISDSTSKAEINRIFGYLRQLWEQESDYLYEAKLLIIGEPGAGKTTLTRKIEDPNYQLDLKQPSTEGIEIIPWFFPRNQDKNFQVNIWDFGGQEIYHATHQFFLTKRSLYLLLADTRKEDTDFFYWLNVVELLSDNSPICIIKNEKFERQREINELQLRGHFSNLKEILATNLATNRGLDRILDTIRHHIQQLPHVGTELPKTWVKVREALDADPRDYIPLDEYLRICQENGFTRKQDALQLSDYLHDLGVCLHFQQDELLIRTVILKPTWGTAAVYRVLDNQRVINHLGQFTKDDLAEIWHEDTYAPMRPELLQLMMNFKLCYPIPNCPNHYIAPQLLTEKQPTYSWPDTNNLNLRYEYSFMPKGILTRFIVETHEWIDHQTYVWRSGVILNYAQQNHTWAEVMEIYRPHKGEIRIRVRGQQKKELLTIVRHELDKIHKTYPRLKYDELVPCNCTTCKDLATPHFYRLKNLNNRLSKGKFTIECDNDPFEDVNIPRLLGDVFTTQDRGSKDPSGASGITYHIGQVEHLHTQWEDRRGMNTSNQYGLGDNIGGDKVMGDKIGTQINNSPNLTQAAQEIQSLLDQLSQTYSDPLVVSKAIEQIENTPTLKERIINALNEGGSTTLEELIHHPAAKILISTIKGFMMTP